MRNVLSIAAILTSAIAVLRPTPPPPQINRADVLEFLSGISMVDVPVDVAGHTVRAARYTGNLQIVNGLGSTETANALGNLIVGYAEVDDLHFGDFRTGSHNIVGGTEAKWTSWGTLVVGCKNWTNAPFSSISGGMANRTDGAVSSIAGGEENGTSIAGHKASISGGYANGATGPYAWVGGGQSNGATGYAASIAGGYNNEAPGESSSVSGGQNRAAPGLSDWVAGSLFEDN